jgi:hypothetical protein
MPVFEKQRTKYYTISKEDHPDGLIRHKDMSGQIHHYGGLEGILTSIDLKEDEYEGEINMKWYFRFEDRDHSMVEILQIGETSSAARSLIMTLISCEERVGWVKIAPYRKNVDGKTYTNLWTEVNGQTIEWKEEVIGNLPEVKEVMVGDKPVLDDTARRKYVRMLARRVMDHKISGTIVHEDGTEADYSGQEPPEQPAGDSSPQAPDGKQQAEQLYDHKKETLSNDSPGQKKDEVNMDGWEDIDDDLPF